MVPETQKLLAEYAELLNEHGVLGDEPRRFACKHRANKEFAELSAIAFNLKMGLDKRYGEPAKPKAQSAFNEQVSGDHYKNMAIQPVEFIHKNGIPFIEGCVIKYVARWKSKGNGVEDLKKARHFLDMLIEMEGGK